jgi:5'-3' exonuclease
MGVPSFFAWLAKHYSDILLGSSYSEMLPIDKRALPTKLYLDFNGAIHPAIRTDPDMTLSDMNDAVTKYLSAILDYIKPDSVYIAIDGVAPAAKMDQQRDRRYKSVKESKGIREINQRHGEKARDHVDFNMISPGTVFMEDLQTHLVNTINELTKPGGIWHNYTFTLDGAHIPGEGEHKIMNDIRSRRQSGISENYLIYGLDADLLFLSILNCPDAILVRENVYFKNREKTDFYDNVKYPYIYLSVPVLVDKIIETLNPHTGLSKLASMGFKHDLIRPEDAPALCANTWWYDAERDHKRLLIDYAYICFFLGNDFVPHLPPLRIRNGSLNDIIVIYKKVGWTLGGFMVNANGTSINHYFLKEMMAEIAYVEGQLLKQLSEERLRSIDSFKRKFNTMTPHKRDLEMFGYIEDTYTDTIKGGTNGWEVRYYNYYHGIDYRSGNSKDYKRRVLPICQSYIDMSRWVLGYYQGTHHNWSWHYPYYAAPIAADIYQYFEELDLENQIVDDTPVGSFEQLMSILPPESANLLPSVLGEYMINPQSELHFMYPIKVNYIMEGNRFRYECRAKIPPVDRVKIKEIVTCLAEGGLLTKEEMARGLTSENMKPLVIAGTTGTTGTDTAKKTVTVKRKHADNSV